MTTKIRPTDHNTFIVYEDGSTDEFEYDEFLTWEEANEWKNNLEEIVDYYDVDTDMDDINEAFYG
jgi:hypothetical protein